MGASASACAVAIGQAVGALFRPGVGVDFAGTTPRVVGEAPSVADQLLGIVPLNPFEALADGDMLGVIFFAILVGAAVRPAAAVMVVNFVAALGIAHRELPFAENRLPLLMLCGAAALVFLGAGPLSVDGWRERRRGRHARAG